MHCGQYSTFGHRSDYLHGDAIPTTLEEKAKDLLDGLVQMRGKVRLTLPRVLHLN